MNAQPITSYALRTLTPSTEPGERTGASEPQLRALRRDLISRGVAVSLMAYDPARRVYAFDVYA